MKAISIIKSVCSVGAIAVVLLAASVSGAPSAHAQSYYQQPYCYYDAYGGYNCTGYYSYSYPTYYYQYQQPYYYQNYQTYYPTYYYPSYSYSYPTYSWHHWWW